MVDELQARRSFLASMCGGMTGIALSQIATADGIGKFEPTANNPKAKQVLQIFCPGAASHIDLWDYKPALEKFDGTPLPGNTEVTFQGKNGNLMKSPWKFISAGETGKRISSMMPNMAKHVDDMAFLHSMTSKTNTHGPGCIFMNSCFTREGFPTAGSWVSYALGSMNENLPTYVAIQDVRGEPPNGKANWSNGFLPARYQAVAISAQQSVRNLKRPAGISEEEETETRKYLQAINSIHANQRTGNDQLAARIASYELAARMQLSAPEVCDLSREPTHIHDLYGTEDENKLKAAYARNCLLSRRMLEQGVRYVSLYCASRASAVDGLLNWDAHKTLKADYERHLPIFDQPTAALITDLKQRGMLDDVVVIWCTEFGRMPTHQEGTSGRDHNPDAFTTWMLGAGVRSGVSYGETDEFGRRSAVNIATPYDFYATILHLLGLNHETLTYYHNGAQRRLTDVHGHVIQSVLA